MPFAWIHLVDVSHRYGRTRLVFCWDSVHQHTFPFYGNGPRNFQSELQLFCKDGERSTTQVVSGRW